MSHTTHFDSGPTDAWHAHAGEAPPQETHGETNPGFIALVGIVGMVIIVALIVILTMYFDNVVLSEKINKQERDPAVRAEIRSTEAQWQQTLSGYGWVDASAGTVSTPISQAMQAVAAEYAAGQ